MSLLFHYTQNISECVCWCWRKNKRSFDIFRLMRDNKLLPKICIIIRQLKICFSEVSMARHCAKLRIELILFGLQTSFMSLRMPDWWTESHSLLIRNIDLTYSCWYTDTARVQVRDHLSSLRIRDSVIHPRKRFPSTVKIVASIVNWYLRHAKRS